MMQFWMFLHRNSRAQEIEMLSGVHARARVSREVDDRHTRSERLSGGREGFVQLSPNVMLSFPVLM